MSFKGGFVYILSSPNRNTIYVGVTSDLRKRIFEHLDKVYPKSFTARYNCIHLVYYQFHDSIEAAIAEEKRMKGLSRAKKEMLIESMNYDWIDLWESVEKEF